MKKIFITTSIMFLLSLFYPVFSQNYTGTYNMMLNGQSTGISVLIQKLGNQYSATLKKSGQNDAVVNMLDTGQGLVGSDNDGILCGVLYYENRLVFQFGANYTFDLVPSKNQQEYSNYTGNYSNQSNSNSGQINQSFVGSWKYANTKTTGTGYGHTFSRNITFFNDGTCIEGTGYQDYELNAHGNSKGNRKSYYVQGNQIIIGNQAFYYSFENYKSQLILGLRTSMDDKEIVFVKN